MVNDKTGEKFKRDKLKNLNWENSYYQNEHAAHLSFQFEMSAAARGLCIQNARKDQKRHHNNPTKCNKEVNNIYLSFFPP